MFDRVACKNRAAFTDPNASPTKRFKWKVDTNFHETPNYAYFQDTELTSILGSAFVGESTADGEHWKLIHQT